MSVLLAENTAGTGYLIESFWAFLTPLLGVRGAPFPIEVKKGYGASHNSDISSWNYKHHYV